MVARGDVGGVDDFASGAGMVAGGADLALSPVVVFEEVETDGEEGDEEDILYGARAGAECAEVARGHKGAGSGIAGVKAHSCKGAVGERVRIGDVC